MGCYVSVDEKKEHALDIRPIKKIIELDPRYDSDYYFTDKQHVMYKVHSIVVCRFFCKFSSQNVMHFDNKTKVVKSLCDMMYFGNVEAFPFADVSLKVILKLWECCKEKNINIQCSIRSYLLKKTQDTIAIVRDFDSSYSLSYAAMKDLIAIDNYAVNMIDKEIHSHIYYLLCCVDLSSGLLALLHDQTKNELIQKEVCRTTIKLFY